MSINKDDLHITYPMPLPSGPLSLNNPNQGENLPMRNTCSDLRITPVTFQLDQEAVDEYRSMDWDQMSDINDGLKASRSDGMVAIVKLPANRNPEYVAVFSFVDTELFVSEMMRCNPYNSGPEVIAIAETDARQAVFDLLREEVAAIADVRTNHTPGVVEWFKVNKQDAMAAFRRLTQAS